jgi:CDP-2,3-bis-(O-geranylgeranyl)-sn-glycerol synthase
MLGVPWEIGLQVGVWAMVGDLTSSLIRRRLKRPPGSSFPVLDQAPESLFPGLAVREELALSSWDLAATVLAFTALDLLLSRRYPQLRE